MKNSIYIALGILLLTGCEVIKEKIVPVKEIVEVKVDSREDWLCTTPEYQQVLNEFCYFENWAKFMIENAQIQWPQRKETIDALGDSPYAVVQKILLSQFNDTPYKFRLRAQNMITRLQTQVEPQVAELLEIVVYNQSQQLLEMESAVTILSRVNVENEKEIESLLASLESRQVELDKQRKQVEQLLKIEATMVDQTNNLDSGNNKE